MIVFAFIMAFLFCVLAGMHTSLIIVNLDAGNDVPFKEYMWTLVDAAIGIYWMIYLTGCKQ